MSSRIFDAIKRYFQISFAALLESIFISSQRVIFAFVFFWQINPLLMCVCVYIEFILLMVFFILLSTVLYFNIHEFVLTRELVNQTKKNIMYVGGSINCITGTCVFF